jgi:hypothetical protein
MQLNQPVTADARCTGRPPDPQAGSRYLPDVNDDECDLLRFTSLFSGGQAVRAGRWQDAFGALGDVLRLRRTTHGWTFRRRCFAGTRYRDWRSSGGRRWNGGSRLTLDLHEHWDERERRFVSQSARYRDGPAVAVFAVTLDRYQPEAVGSRWSTTRPGSPCSPHSPQRMPRTRPSRY